MFCLESKFDGIKALCPQKIAVFGALTGKAKVAYHVSDSSSRTKGKGGVTYIYEDFSGGKPGMRTEFTSRHPDTDFVSVVWEGGTLEQITRVANMLGQFRKGDSLTLVWMGNEYYDTDKESKFARGLQKLLLLRDRMHSIHFVALASDEVWHYGPDYTEFVEKCRPVIGATMSATSGILWSTGMELVEKQLPTKNGHVATSHGEELRDIILDWMERAMSGVAATPYLAPSSEVPAAQVSSTSIASASTDVWDWEYTQDTSSALIHSTSISIPSASADVWAAQVSSTSIASASTDVWDWEYTQDTSSALIHSTSISIPSASADVWAAQVSSTSIASASTDVWDAPVRASQDGRASEVASDNAAVSEDPKQSAVDDVLAGYIAAGQTHGTRGTCACDGLYQQNRECPACFKLAKDISMALHDKVCEKAIMNRRQCQWRIGQAALWPSLHLQIAKTTAETPVPSIPATPASVPAMSASQDGRASEVASDTAAVSEDPKQSAVDDVLAGYIAAGQTHGTRGTCACDGLYQQNRECPACFKLAKDISMALHDKVCEKAIMNRRQCQWRIGQAALWPSLHLQIAKTTAETPVPSIPATPASVPAMSVSTPPGQSEASHPVMSLSASSSEDAIDAVLGRCPERHVLCMHCHQWRNACGFKHHLQSCHPEGAGAAAEFAMLQITDPEEAWRTVSVPPSCFYKIPTSEWRYRWHFPYHAYHAKEVRDEVQEEVQEDEAESNEAENDDRQEDNCYMDKHWCDMFGFTCDGCSAYGKLKLHPGTGAYAALRYCECCWGAWGWTAPAGPTSIQSTTSFIYCTGSCMFCRGAAAQGTKSRCEGRLLMARR